AADLARRPATELRAISTPIEESAAVPSRYREKYAQAHVTGKRVSDLMRERKMTFTSLAESIRLQRSTLENYCAGRSIPNELLLAIAGKLQTTVAYLTLVSDD